VGSGKIVNLSKKESIRGHTDLAKSQAPLHKPAVDYYTALSNRAIAISSVVDVYACSLDQTFALEVRHLVARTGGLIVLADKFNQSVFRESLRRVFAKTADTPEGPGGLTMGFGANIEVISSREVKVSGAIGPCATMDKKGPTVSETEIGVGGTTQWYMGGIDPSATMAFFFDVTNTNATPLPQHKRRYLQFLTTYVFCSIAVPSFLCL
jgi:protein transport protein SEC23